MNRTRCIGLFGGSFDPPHIGHMTLVEAALKWLPEVWVIPAGNPVHRRLSERADAHTRLEWIRQMFSSERRVRVLDWEMDDQKPTPAIATLRRMRRLYPELSAVLLMGEDAFAGITTWVGYPEHLTLCDVAVFSRSGHVQTGIENQASVTINEWRKQAGSGRIIRVEALLPDVSATRLRMMASQGKPLPGLVPEMIRKDIEGAYGQLSAGSGVGY